MLAKLIINGSLSFKLKLLVAATTMAVGLLVVVPSAEAQVPSFVCQRVPLGGEVCLEKTASPNQAIVGEPITFTVNEFLVGVGPTSPSDWVERPDPLIDVLPPEVRVVSVTQTASPGVIAPPCIVSGNTVTCPGRRWPVTPPGAVFTLTIVAIPTTPGDFVNTVSYSVLYGPYTAQAPFTVLPATTPTQPGGESIATAGETVARSGGS